jgi:transposase
LAALLAGEEDPVVLAELAKGRLRPKIPALREALAHRFRLEHHGLLVAQMLAHVNFLEDPIAQTYRQVDVLLRPVMDVVELVMTIPGVGRRVAEVLVAEVGLDMNAFPTPGISPPGLASAPATTPPVGSAVPGTPGTDQCGCASH